MRTFGLPVALMLICAWGAQANSLQAPNGFEPLGPLASHHVWVRYDPAWQHFWLPPITQIRTAQPVNSSDLLAAATANVSSLSDQPVNDPDRGLFGPLLSVPEPNTFDLLSFSFLLAGGIIAYRKRRQGQVTFR